MEEKTNLTQEIEKRRTFAIISHPDAGKTTITEQFLLASNVIRSAGTVKGRKSGKFAQSDWMEIEKKRGISVTSTVLEFNYQDCKINLLDTPGHQDFSEDTYRTLSAVDSAVMVIDSAKGIEAQTKKLFQVTKQRGIPLFTFMNKLDREGRSPMDLVDEIENTLGIEGYPMNWPIGMGKNFRGIYNISQKRIELNLPNGEVKVVSIENGIPADQIFKEPIFQEAFNEVELLKEAGNSFDPKKIQSGEQTPVFFGSALTNFGVKTFLDEFVKMAPSPATHEDVNGQVILPDDATFSGFVFKIQANMNPHHRDRIAFIRICSGEFNKGMEVLNERSGKGLKLNSSTINQSSDNEQVSKAVAGDIIGLFDNGNYQIGDTIHSGKKNLSFPPLPTFTPELFCRVRAKNVMKQKSYHKGVNQLVSEGSVQLFKEVSTGDYILGAVGQLQFEVFTFRMQNEYSSEVELVPMGNRIARWIEDENVDEHDSSSRNLLVKDIFDGYLYLFENTFALRWYQDKHPKVKLVEKI
ncbi:peptide chain release factor 3 [Xylocopilactobacillus apicola]|uniref:Peptide chain release factor 3 n=1 Tax=Xylocopilactobacillus apicola TaxID=2932184 RepID=A0AAU9D8X8_9LACO|nr:peptide chain release factor 3 [Xylocopilactobacillus apicola]BDR58856.1 peptide chain release factor 3 [Xylocopilactobacillus apicola]